MDDTALTTDPVPPQDPARLATARRSAPTGAAQPLLDALAALTMRLLRTGACQLSLLTDVQTTSAGAGLASAAVGEVTPLAEALCTLTTVARGPVVVPDAVADARVRDLPAVASGAIGAYLAAPVAAEGGHVVGALCVFDPVGRDWTGAEVALLGQLADFAAAVLAGTTPSGRDHARRALWELSVEAAGIGTFDLDVTSGRLSLDDQGLALSGVDPATATGRPGEVGARIHPDDLGSVVAEVEAAIATGAACSVQYRVVLPDGGQRWVAARGQALVDGSGATTALLGALYDVTALRSAATRLAQTLESMAVGHLDVDPGGRVTSASSRAERTLGSPAAALVGSRVRDVFGGPAGTEVETGCRRAAGTGRPVALDVHCPAPLDAWYEVRTVPEDDVVGVYFSDITERRRAQDHAELLALVTEQLTGTLDAEEAVARLAQLVVPALGDWCVVTLADQGSAGRAGLRDVGSWHADPELRELVEAYADVRLDALSDDAFLLRALRSARTVTVQGDATEAIRAVLDDGPARDLLGALAPAYARVVPLRARGRTLGLVTMFASASRGDFTPWELATASDIAGRAGLALDNARLYREQRDLAEGLQRSLLTPPPQPDHCQVVVRYRAAAQAAQVGGDWYDAFLQPGGATVLVIGDVIGHDTEAAAAMSQVRTLLRGIGALADAGPAEVLRQVDSVVETLRVDTTASAVVARLEQTDGERAGATTRLRWSNAGHPPPLVLDPEGGVRVLDGAGADVLLGVVPATSRREHQLVLDRGAVVLLYTDGLVERRGQSLDEGIERLSTTLAELGADRGLGLDELCDQLLARMLPTRPDDDVALVAVRLHPEDRPRPPGAGPDRVPPGPEGPPGTGR